MKAALVDSHRERIRRIEAGEQIVVGVNRYTETEPSPLLGGRRRRDPRPSTPRSRPQQREAVGALARASATRAPSTRRSPSSRAVARRRREHHGGDDRRRPRRA